jgi:hypothetical protein
MTRYIDEFAKAKMNSLRGLNQKLQKIALERISKALKLNERNYITDFEAVEIILNAEKNVSNAE